jgi:hypothetical protein
MVSWDGAPPSPHDAAWLEVIVQARLETGQELARHLIITNLVTLLEEAIYGLAAHRALAGQGMSGVEPGARHAPPGSRSQVRTAPISRDQLPRRRRALSRVSELSSLAARPTIP